MNEISNVAIIQWQNELMKIKDDKGQTYSPTYLCIIHAQLSSILNHACRYCSLKTNVARDVGTMGEKEADEMSFWTQEEYESFYTKNSLEKEIYEVDLESLRDLYGTLSVATNKINQIVKRVNQTGIIYKSDIDDIKNYLRVLKRARNSTFVVAEAEEVICWIQE